ncbi:MAG: YafY family transcriptional regulator [Aquabacterium sp.]|uniref:helix-turn-helix transcriptional regulator n=1 Tax=Aquabacterium sp. TaxID=1872578 RepID=UPI0025C107E5|nr:YafY family protein [Aquabacterium sp.]MBI5926735.1 YafY family transcriptional regulator [Aquabacterium sp.]
MRRADRLFQLLQLIRGRRLSTAAWLAQRMEVSVRTVYRDVAALQVQGVPIEGEAGVGYRVARDYSLPPLMFTPEQAQALVASVRIARSRLDPALAAQAEEALSKILSVLPLSSRVAADSLPLHAPARPHDSIVLTRLGQLRVAIESRQVLHIDYADVKGQPSQRTLRPLACFYWESAWTLSAWCELRQDFRQFRLDRIRKLLIGPGTFKDEAGKTLADMFRQWCEPPPFL